METKSEWKWWSGRDEERMTYGPFHSRQDAIQAAQDDACSEFQDESGQWKVGVHVVEARQDPLRLAEWVGSEWILERAEESLCDSDRVSSEQDDGPWFEASKEQEADLAERLMRACDEWQAAHGLVFTPNTFSHSRNAEYVVVAHPNDEEAAA